MQSNFFISSSILRKFLIFNLVIFLFLGIFTFLYLKAIKPNLVQNRSEQHARIIDNTTDHINRISNINNVILLRMLIILIILMIISKVFLK